MKIKKGDIVGRKSYGKDILFEVDRIIKTSNKSQFAILKGITVRIQADSPLDDLELMEKSIISRSIEKIDNIMIERINKCSKMRNNRNHELNKSVIYTGKILHLDGDRKYSEKSSRYYKKMGLNAVVKNIPENRQQEVIKMLLNKYNPDILVITGHDAMLKNGTNFNNIYNYRNSRHFINTVKEARKWQGSQDKLVIFARRMSEFF